MEIAYIRVLYLEVKRKNDGSTSALLLSLMPDRVYHYLPRVSS